MSYPLKRINTIHDPQSNSKIAHEILVALENETLKLVWLLPLSCAIVLNKAISSMMLSKYEQFVLKTLHVLIQKGKVTKSWLKTWIDIIYFIEIEEEEQIS
jgi:hypothetical protein